MVSNVGKFVLKTYYIKKILFNIYSFLREREHEWGKGGPGNGKSRAGRVLRGGLATPSPETEGDTESEAVSWL